MNALGSEWLRVWSGGVPGKPALLARLLAAASLLSTSPSLLAQGTLTTILDNGPASNRVNLVVLAEGYTASQSAAFLRDATNTVNHLLATQPYSDYSEYFNASAIFVASAQAGSDHPVTLGPYRDTYFNSAYEIGDRLITIPPNGLDANPAHGLAKVDALVTDLTPHADLVVLLVNDALPGGSAVVGGPNGTSNRIPIIVSKNQSWPNDGLVAHEAAHAFAGLVDEYTDAYPGYTPVEAPNATRTTDRAAIRWKAWIDATTPIPTAADEAHANIVGLFLGAQYQTSGWYRPKLQCRMGQDGLYYEFCEVCAEQIVKSLYQVVRPIDAASPASPNLTLQSVEPVDFSVATPLRQTQDLRAQWYTNDIAVSDATNLTYVLQPRQLGNGSHNVRVIVNDPTTWVRNDPARVLYATNSWFVTVALSELRLTVVRYVEGDSIHLTVSGSAPQGFVIEASTNLIDWIRLTTNTLAGGKCDFTDAGLGNVPLRFYRTVSPP